MEEIRQASDLWHRRGKRSEEVWQGEALAEGLRMVSRMPHVPERVRAFLSDRYRPLDNDELAEVVFPALSELDVEILCPGKLQRQRGSPGTGADNGYRLWNRFHQVHIPK